MKKLIIIIIILAVGIFNFRLVSTNGFATIATQDNNVVTNVSNLLSIEKVEYYENPFAFMSDVDSEETFSKEFVLIVTCENESFLYFATQNDINALSVAGFFINSISPVKQNVIPAYAFAIAIIVVLLIPMKKRG